MAGGVCVITGGGRGIGAATARLATAHGWRVCLSYRTDERAAQEIAAELGGHAVRADVAVEDDVVGLFRAAADLGPITAAVANAGIVAPVARIDEMSGERLRRMIEVNTLGAMYTVREAVRHMSVRLGGPGGSIVAVSSAASRLGSPGQYVDYAASKGAVDSLIIGVARETAADGVRANAVRPGIIDTEIHASGGQPDRVAALGPDLPMRRAGTAEEVAAAVIWLLSDEASYTTGAIVDVSGAR